MNVEDLTLYDYISIAERKIKTQRLSHLLTNEDAISFIAECVMQAAQTYKEDRMPLKAYLDLHARYGIGKWIQLQQKKKRSIDMVHQSALPNWIWRTCSLDKQLSPDKELINKEEKEMLVMLADIAKLTKVQRKHLELILHNRTPTQISKDIGNSKKNAHYVCGIVKDKLQQAAQKVLGNDYD
jgi:hypothetical protein